MVYCFTKTTVWAEWLAAQQDVYLKIIDIVQSHGADFAFPSQTLYMDNITPPTVVAKSDITGVIHKGNANSHHINASQYT